MESAEALFLLLEELGISAGLFYRSLAPTMRDLQAGRAFKPTALEEQLALPDAYLSVLQETLPEFERGLRDFQTTPESSETIKSLGTEGEFYRRFHTTARGLMQKLNLIAQAGSLSPLGNLPIQDLWEEIEQLVHHP